eukprot:2753958-Amphidinium_carterae.1
MSGQDNGDMAEAIYGSQHQLTKESIKNLLSIVNALRPEDCYCDMQYAQMILRVLENPNSAYRPAHLTMKQRDL